MSKRYSLIDPVGGRVAGGGWCAAEDDVSQYSLGGLVAIEGEATEATHYFASGQLHAYTAEQAIAKAGPHAEYELWDDTSMAWLDPRTLEQIKAAKWAEIKAQRDSRESGGFPYMGRTLDSDMLSVMRMKVAESSALAAKSAGVTGVIEQWRCADNSLLPMTADDVLGMLLALGAWGAALHAQANTLRASIDAAETIAATEAITWPE